MCRIVRGPVELEEHIHLSQENAWEELCCRATIVLRNWTGLGTEQCNNAVKTLSLEGILKVA